MMGKQLLLALIASAAAIGATPAAAATQIDVTLGAMDGDFVTARPATLADRQYVGSGSIQFLSTLTNGTYGLADIASFNLLLELKFRPTVAPPGFYITADYHFGLSDLSAFQITYAGGTPVSASWTLNPVSAYQSSAGFSPAPASVDFDSAGVGVSFYAWPSLTKTLVARTDSLEATFGQTSAVPEPATWAMMLIGFGGIGSAARYRRRKVSVSVARPA